MWDLRSGNIRGLEIAESMYTRGAQRVERSAWSAARRARRVEHGA